MTVKPIIRLTAAVATAAFVLAACQSDEAKISEFMTSGQSLAASGDHLRAMIQFRNVLKLDPEHVEASAALAASLMETGDVFSAQQEFTGLAERFPEEITWRHALAEIALIRSDWASLDRHARQAKAIDPDRAEAQVLDLATGFREAKERADASRAVLIAREAEDLLAALPDDPILLRIVVEHHASSGNPEAALPILDAALDRNPRQPELQILRIRLLSDDRQVAAAEERLLALAALYPQDLDIASILVARHVSKGDFVAAETVLRGLSDATPRSESGLRITLIRFLKQVHGADAAMAEIRRQIEVTDGLPAAALFRALERTLRHDLGEDEGTVEDLAALAEGLENTPEGAQIQVLAARMMEKAGDQAGARDAIDAVLAQDPGNVPALKLRAAWLLEQDDTKTAIVALRTARAQAPRDTEVMTLLAAAHATDGDMTLAMEQLASAALASGHGARESERYALALMDDGRAHVAGRVLEAAHASNPGDVRIATALADLHVRQENWSRARSLLSHLSQLGSRAAEDALAPLEAAILEGEGRRDEAFALLDTLLIDGPEDRRPVVLMVQSLMRLGKPDVARDYVDRALAAEPDDLALRMLDASLHQQAGDLEQAATGYRALVTTGGSDLAARQLFVVLREQGQHAEAEAALDEGLRHFPASRSLRLIEAERREVSGDVAGAIALLRDLYREDMNDVVVINNLASLLATHTDHPADLAMAIKLASTLRSRSVPAIADTVGWVAYRQGDLDRAVPLLERAARGLPRDPAVQLRLAKIYAATGRPEDARAVLDKILYLTDDDDPVTVEAAALAESLPRPLSQ